MKRIAALLAGLLCLASCAREEPADYVNSPEYVGMFYMDDTVYYKSAGSIWRYHADLDHRVEGLCRDPLCEHKYENGLCPDSDGFMPGGNVITDGVRLYKTVWNTRRSLEVGDGAMIRQIYSVNPDGTDMKLLTEFEFTRNSSYNMAYHDGYIYYMRGFYNDLHDPSADHYVDASDQYTRLWRVSVDGRAEEVLDRDFTTKDWVYVDDEYYYFREFSRDTEGYAFYDFRLIDRETGEETVLTDPEGGSAQAVITYREETYVIFRTLTAEITYAETSRFFTYDVYRYENGTLTSIASDCGAYHFADGALWTVPQELEYIGTKDMPTGKGSEKLPVDFFRQYGGSLTRIDLTTVETRTWQLADPEEHISFYGVSEGVVIAFTGSARRNFENGPYGAMCKLALNDDGTMTVMGTISNEAENGD